MDKKFNTQTAELFAREFAACFGEALSKAAGSPVSFTVKDAPDLSKRSDEAVHFRVAVNDGGECFIEMYKPDVLAIGSKIVGDAASEYKEQCVLAQQVIAAMLPKLEAKLGANYGDVRLAVEPVSDLVFGGMLVVPLMASGVGTEFPVLLYFSSRFDDALRGGKQQLSGSMQSSSYLNARNLDLVMDVELSVTLRFGQRELALREVLELESGSVIELDRRVDAPVELLLDGKVIAIGEAVIVDGNYGLRVTKVPQPITSHWN
jgi:flagellar motor switch protein FliN/FliY